MIYWASAAGASDIDIQKRNLEFAARELDKCSSCGESYVYVVPAHIIFDMTVPGRCYTEFSCISPTCYAGEICVVAENMVFEYEHGYIIRRLPLIEGNFISTRLDRIRHGYYEGKKIVDTSFQFSSRTVIEDVALDIVNSPNTKSPHIQHLFSGIRFTVSYIAFQLLGEECGIEFDPNGDVVFQDIPSSLCTDTSNARRARHLSHWTYDIGERKLAALRCPKTT